MEGRQGRQSLRLQLRAWLYRARPRARVRRQPGCLRAQRRLKTTAKPSSEDMSQPQGASTIMFAPRLIFWCDACVQKLGDNTGCTVPMKLACALITVCVRACKHVQTSLTHRCDASNCGVGGEGAVQRALASVSCPAGSGGGSAGPRCCPRGMTWKRAGVAAWNSATCSASGRHSCASACARRGRGIW